ncbi:MAG: chromate transporter [Oscillospiraceae bacterium]|nr:chromate transporter [Oscillospiraceae bacterium]
MLLLHLYFEFAKVGLFAVGGGLATMPFLEDMGRTTGWFTMEQLSTMIAVSESTPGPIGVNMATYVGFELAGVLGAVVATLGLVTPSVVVILIIAGFLQRFRSSAAVNNVFGGLRPASTALIAAAGLNLALAVFVAVGGTVQHTFGLNWGALLIAAVVFAALRLKKLKKLHPIVFIGLSALAGIILKL